jgi:ABC-2 type transport system ATP-binding protein
MAQKVQFITTVIHEPKLLILDEPFSGFDPINANLIKSELMRLRDEGATIMLSTHNMGSVEEICDHIALINNARVVLEGPVKEVRNKYKEGVYDLTFKGDMISFTNALWANFELIRHSDEEGQMRRARIRIMVGATVNELLKSVIPVVEVHSLNEVIPSMNDIFIKVVQQKENNDE